MDGPLPDPRLDALETAAVLVQQTHVVDLLEVLTAEAQRDFAADWAAVVDLEDGNILVSTGEPPEPQWLTAFLGGSTSSTTTTNGDAGPDDVAYALFPVGGIALVLGRDGKAFRARERRQLLALAKVAGHLWSELTGEVGMKHGARAGAS
ncbi:MAG: hypothetical protein JO148_10395 [Acidimicrobiia bacterium]|nr:hypothetical protein [Acidimicrobiia bacterium]